MCRKLSICKDTRSPWGGRGEGGHVVIVIFDTRQFNCQVVAGVWQGMAGVTPLCLRLWQSAVAGRERRGECCAEDMTEDLRKGWGRGEQWRSIPGQAPAAAHCPAALGDAGDSFAAWSQQDPDKLLKSLCGGLLIRCYGYFPCLDPNAAGKGVRGRCLEGAS